MWQNAWHAVFICFFFLTKTVSQVHQQKQAAIVEKSQLCCDLISCWHSHPQGRERLDGWHYNSALWTSQPTLTSSPVHPLAVWQFTVTYFGPCGAAVKAQRIMANQPTIMATPPTGATLRRPGSFVRAWWYSEPQNIPIPAMSRVPACVQGERRGTWAIY